MGKSLTPFKPANGSGTLPYAREIAREKLNELAGITDEERAKFLRMALDKLFEKLTATKTELLSYKGILTEKVTVEDHTAQLAAIQKIMDWCDVIRGKGEGESTAPVKFVINFPDWHKPPVTVDAVCEEVVAGDSPAK